MRKLIVRWSASAIPLVLGVSLITFVLTSLVPGDPGRAILGANATPDQVRSMDHQLGLDRPLPDRYWDWLTKAFRGDLGHSVTSGVPVLRELTARLGVTACLIVGAVLVAGLVGIGLGVLSAVRGGRLGRVVDVLSLVGLAIPNYWFALVLITAFAVQLPIFPATGYTAFSASPVAWFESLVLPVLTLGLTSAAPIAKQTRDGVLEQFGRDYVRVLRSRGVRERTIIFRHVLRNAAAPILTILGLIVVALFGATVLVETVFVLPGLGGLVASAAAAHDIPTVQGVTLVFTVLAVLTNLVIEVLYGLIDPRVRA